MAVHPDPTACTCSCHTIGGVHVAPCCSGGVTAPIVHSYTSLRREGKRLEIVTACGMALTGDAKMTPIQLGCSPWAADTTCTACRIRVGLPATGANA